MQEKNSDSGTPISLFFSFTGNVT